MSNPKSCTLRTTRATDSFVVLVTKRTCARQRGRARVVSVNTEALQCARSVNLSLCVCAVCLHRVLHLEACLPEVGERCCGARQGRLADVQGAGQVDQHSRKLPAGRGCGHLPARPCCQAGEETERGWGDVGGAVPRVLWCQAGVLGGDRLP